MNMLIESPWPWLLGGIVVEGVLAVMLLQTRRGTLLLAMAGVAIVTGLGLVAEHFVMTDRKAVRQTLDEGVAAVRANDLNRLLNCISPTAERARALSRYIFNRARFDGADIYRLDVTVNRQTSPPTAMARFDVVGQGKDRMSEYPYGSFARHVEVELRLEHGRWLATDYGVENVNFRQ
jgi:hypothetical protein